MSCSHHSLYDSIKIAEELGDIQPACDLVLTKEQKDILKKQAHSAAGFAEQCTWTLQAVGTLLALSDGNASDYTVAQIGHTVSQIAEYAHTMRDIESNANWLLEEKFEGFPTMAELKKGEAASVKSDSLA